METVLGDRTSGNFPPPLLGFPPDLLVQSWLPPSLTAAPPPPPSTVTTSIASPAMQRPAAATPSATGRRPQRGSAETHDGGAARSGGRRIPSHLASPTRSSASHYGWLAAASLCTAPPDADAHPAIPVSMELPETETPSLAAPMLLLQKAPPAQTNTAASSVVPPTSRQQGHFTLYVPSAELEEEVWGCHKQCSVIVCTDTGKEDMLSPVMDYADAARAPPFPLTCCSFPWMVMVPHCTKRWINGCCCGNDRGETRKITLYPSASTFPSLSDKPHFYGWQM